MNSSKVLLHTRRMYHILRKKRFKNTRKIIFIVAVCFSFLFVEFVVAYNSPQAPLSQFAYFVDSKGNSIENALGRLTITDIAKIVLKGSGSYSVKVLDRKKQILFEESGVFNKSGFCEITFVLSPLIYKVGEEYQLEIIVIDTPFPLIFRHIKLKKTFVIYKDIPKLGIGIVKIDNRSVVIAKLFDETSPLRNKEIIFHYKKYATNQSFQYLGKGKTNQKGMVSANLTTFDSSQIYLVKAEFLGDSHYEAVATDSVFIPEVTEEEIQKYSAFLLKINETEKLEKKGPPVTRKVTSHKVSSLIKNKGIATAFTISETYKENKNTQTRNIEKKQKDVSIKFSDDDYAKMSLVQFLKKITTEDTPASLILDVVEILNNLNDLPYVAYKLGIILSKVDVALIPIVSGNSIILYKVHVIEYSKKVAKQVTETVTETTTEYIKKTKTVYKKVTRWVKELIKLVKWVKVKHKGTYQYWIPFKWVTKTYTYYTWELKVNWKSVWKKVTKTVKDTVTYWVKKTKIITRTITKTVYETIKVRQEKKENVYKIDLKNLKVVNIANNEEMKLEDWLLSLLGLNKNVLQKITGFLLDKIIGPASKIFQEIINYLINVAKLFLKSLIDDVINYFYMRLLLRATFNNQNIKANGLTNPKTTRVGEIDIHVPLSHPWILFRNLKIRDSISSKWGLSYWTRGVINLGKIKAYFNKAIGENTIIVFPVGSEQLMARVQYDKYDNRDRKSIGIDNVYWVDSDDFRLNVLKNYIPLGIYREAFFVFKIDENNKIKYNVVLLFTFINPDAKLINEETLRLAFGSSKDYNAFKKAIEIITTEPEKINGKPNQNYKSAKDFLQKAQLDMKKDAVEGIFVPDWLISYIRDTKSEEIKKGVWSFEDLTYRDFYRAVNILLESNKKEYKNVEDIIRTACEKSAIVLNDPTNPTKSKITISNDNVDLKSEKYTKFSDILEIAFEAEQKENRITNQEGTFARFVFVTPKDIKNNPFFTPKNRISSKIGSTLPLIRELTDADANTEINKNFDAQLGRLLIQYFKNIKETLEIRGTGYSKIALIHDSKVKMRNNNERVEYTPHLALDPTNLEKSKRNNLNAYTSNPVVDIALRALDKRIRKHSTNANNYKQYRLPTRIRELVVGSLLYAYRTAIYYQINPRDIEVIETSATVVTANNQKTKSLTLTLYDLVGNTEKIINAISGQNVKEEYKKQNKNCVRFTPIEIEKRINGEQVKVTIDSSRLLSGMTKLDIKIIAEYKSRRTGKYTRVGFVDITNLDNQKIQYTKSKDNFDLNKIYLLGLSLSRPLNRILEIANVQTRDSTKKLELQLIGHHGVLHPYFKSMISLVSGFKEEIVKKGEINANIEQDFIKMFNVFGQVDLLRTMIESSINNKSTKLTNKEKNELKTLKEKLEGIKDEISIRSSAKEPSIAKNYKKIIDVSWKGGEISVKLKKTFFTAGITALGILTNPAEATKSAFLQEVKALALIKISMSFLVTLVSRYPKTLLTILNDKDTKNALGTLLTTVVLFLFSIDMTYIFKKQYGAKFTEELGEKADKYDSFLVMFAYILVGIGTFLSYFDVPFYMGKELVLVIGKRIGDVLGENAEHVWNTVAGFEIPMTGQTIFEMVIELPLSGLSVSIAELLVSALYQFVKMLFEQYILNWITDTTLDFICTMQF